MRVAKGIENLNAATRSSYELVGRRIDRLNDTQATMRAEMQQVKEELKQEMQHTLNQKFRELNGRLDRVVDLVVRAIDGAVTRNDGDGGSDDNQEATRQEPAETNTTANNSVATREALNRHIAERNAGIQQRREELRNELVGRPQRGLNEALRATARLPQMPTKLPRTFLALLDQWSIHGLDEFINASRKNWTSNAIRQAFEKYLYLYRHVEANQQPNEAMRDTARRLDQRLGTRTTLASHYKQLKLMDPNVIPRNRSWRGARERGNGRPTVVQPTATTNINRVARQGQQFHTGDRSLRFLSRLPPRRQNNPPQRFLASADGGIDGRRARRTTSRSTDNVSPYAAAPENYDCEDDQYNRHTSGGRFRLV